VRNVVGRTDKPTASCFVLGLYLWLSICGKMARNIPPAWGLGEGVTSPQNKINIWESYREDAEHSVSMRVHRVFLTM